MGKKSSPPPEVVLLCQDVDFSLWIQAMHSRLRSREEGKRRGVCGESGNRSSLIKEPAEAATGDDSRPGIRMAKKLRLESLESMEALAYEEFRINGPTSETRGLFSSPRLLNVRS